MSAKQFGMSGMSGMMSGMSNLGEFGVLLDVCEKSFLKRTICPLVKLKKYKF